MTPREQLEREIERLETRLDRASDARAIHDLVTVRRGLAGGTRESGMLENVRVGFACKERWEDMVGDDRVRACGGCDRPVFNLSAMTRAEAEAVLATRGLTPCVRFYRRPDGTMMTTDCPTSTRVSPRRLAVVASSLAALGAAPAVADPTTGTPNNDDDPKAATNQAAGGTTTTGEPPDHIESTQYVVAPISIQQTYTVTMGAMVVDEVVKRPKFEWSVWGRLGKAITSERPDAVAQRVVGPAVEESDSTWEGAVGADLTFSIGRRGDLRLGAWGEHRSTTGAIGGAELVVERLPPHPYGSRIDGSGSLVLRAGANDRIITGALGFGYVGSWDRSSPWIPWARHVIGARVVLSVNRAIDAPHDWSATIGLEIEPLGLVHKVLDVATGR